MFEIYSASFHNSRKKHREYDDELIIIVTELIPLEHRFSRYTRRGPTAIFYPGFRGIPENPREDSIPTSSPDFRESPERSELFYAISTIPVGRLPAADGARSAVVLRSLMVTFSRIVLGDYGDCC